MTLLKFEGELPFSLPAMQRAAAIAQAENIEMTLYVIDPVSAKQVPVHVLMTQKIADKLITQLIQASAVAREHGQKG